jgi:hypothetical protein
MKKSFWSCKVFSKNLKKLTIDYFQISQKSEIIGIHTWHMNHEKKEKRKQERKENGGKF